MTIKTKICGLNHADAVQAAVEGGADYLGFIFYPPSPRHIDPLTAGHISVGVPESMHKVAVTVNITDDELYHLLEVFHPTMLQLHGQEVPERVAHVKEKTGLPVIKALPVAKPDDLFLIAAYEGVADMLLFDAKPRPTDTLPGGNGVPFDWSILKGIQPHIPWFLSGGLTAENVAEAVEITGAEHLDVSSGVEDAPGVKNSDKIQHFLEKTSMLRSA